MKNARPIFTNFKYLQSRLGRLVLVLVFLMSSGFAAFAEHKDDLLESINLSADIVRYARDSQDLEAEGQVKLVFQKKQVTCDSLKYDLTSGDVTAKGAVIIQADDKQLRAKVFEFNIENATALLIDAELTIWKSDADGNPQRVALLKGAQLQRREDGSWRILEGWLTLCDCGDDPPSWSVSCRQAVVEEGESVEASGPVFRIRDVPVMGLPRLKLPLSQRHTGFLAPSVGYSDRLGARLEDEFFWAIDPHRDMTVGLDGMHKRGVRPTLEYRYKGQRSRGNWSGYYLYDFGADYYRTPLNRFGITIENTFEITDSWRQVLDVELYSDTQALADFGRTWRERSPDFAESRAQLVGQFDRTFLGIEIEYAQRLFDASEPDGWLWNPESDQNIHLLPSARIDIPFRPFFGGRVLARGGLSVDNLYLPSDSFGDVGVPGFTKTTVPVPVLQGLGDGIRQGAEPIARASRLTLDAGLAFPLQLGRYASWRSEAGFTHRQLFLQDKSSQMMADGFLDLSSEMESVIHKISTGQNGNRFLHSMFAGLFWRMTPFEYHTGEDNAGALRWVIPRDFRVAGHAVGGRVGQELSMREMESGNKYRLLDLSYTQRVFLDDAAVSRFGRLDDGTLDLGIEYEMIRWTADLGWRWQDSAVGSASSRLNLGRFGGLAVGHVYRYLSEGNPRGAWLLQNRDNIYEPLHQTGLNLDWQHKNRVHTSYEIDISLDNPELIEQAWRLGYRSSCNCWSADLIVYHRPGLNAPDVYLTIDLASLAEGG